MLRSKYLQHPQAKKGLRKAAIEECRKVLEGGVGTRGLGPPLLARITRRTECGRPLARAAAKEHLKWLRNIICGLSVTGKPLSFLLSLFFHVFIVILTHL